MISVITENWIRVGSSNPVSAFLVGRCEWLLSSLLKPPSMSSCSTSEPLKEIAFSLAPHLSFHGNQSRHVCSGRRMLKRKKMKNKKAHTLIIILWQQLRADMPTNFNLVRSHKNTRGNTRRTFHFFPSYSAFSLNPERTDLLQHTFTHTHRTDNRQVQSEQEKERVQI